MCPACWWCYSCPWSLDVVTATYTCTRHGCGGGERLRKIPTLSGFDGEAGHGWHFPAPMSCANSLSCIQSPALSPAPVQTPDPFPWPDPPQLPSFAPRVWGQPGAREWGSWEVSPSAPSLRRAAGGRAAGRVRRGPPDPRGVPCASTQTQGPKGWCQACAFTSHCKQAWEASLTGVG